MTAGKALTDGEVETGDLKQFFEERTGILEYDRRATEARGRAGDRAITATYARNRLYAWASLREALSGYPALSPLVPDRPGTVDSIPFAMFTLADPLLVEAALATILDRAALPLTLSPCYICVTPGTGGLRQGPQTPIGGPNSLFRPHFQRPTSVSIYIH